MRIQITLHDWFGSLASLARAGFEFCRASFDSTDSHDNFDNANGHRQYTHVLVTCSQQELSDFFFPLATMHFFVFFFLLNLEKLTLSSCISYASCPIHYFFLSLALHTTQSNIKKLSLHVIMRSKRLHVGSIAGVVDVDNFVSTSTMQPCRTNISFYRILHSERSPLLLVAGRLLALAGAPHRLAHIVLLLKELVGHGRQVVDRLARRHGAGRRARHRLVVAAGGSGGGGLALLALGRVDARVADQQIRDALAVRRRAERVVGDL